MKPISNDYLTYILGKGVFFSVDLYTITLKSGNATRISSSDVDIIYDGNTFYANSIIIEHLNYKQSVGWSVDEQNVQILFRPEDTIDGANFIESVIGGILDGATIKRETAFWKRQDGNVIGDVYYYPVPGGPIAQRVPLQIITRFTGYVATVDKIGQTSVELSVRSQMGLLDIEMPRNTYQPGCQWNLFSVGCTLNRDDFAYNGVVDTANELGFTATAPWPIQTGADNIAYYAEGRVEFTSGDNIGLKVSIRGNDVSIATYAFPPIVGVAPGDTFTIWPGCSKALISCDLKFSNKPNHRGFSKVPPVMVSL